jgi:hypothetical protein
MAAKIHAPGTVDAHLIGIGDITMRRFLIPLLLSLGASACAGRATYTTSGTYDDPDLVYAEPGVQVIADYNEPVFYADNYYWRQDNGRWYRSNYHNRGWTVSTPTVSVSRIRQPERYRHYRPNGYVSRRDHDRGRRGRR